LIIYIFLSSILFQISCPFSRDHRTASSRERHAARVGDLRLILSNLVYHTSDSVSVVHLVAQFVVQLVAQLVAQPSLSLGQDTICNKFCNLLPLPILAIKTFPRCHITPHLAPDPDHRREGQRLPGVFPSPCTLIYFRWSSSPVSSPPLTPTRWLHGWRAPASLAPAERGLARLVARR
jgi:hypothetical protein